MKPEWERSGDGGGKVGVPDGLTVERACRICEKLLRLPQPRRDRKPRRADRREKPAEEADDGGKNNR